MSESREACLSEFRDRIATWNSRLQELEDEASRSVGDDRKRTLREIAGLRAKRNSLRRRVAALEVASAGAWDQMKDGAREILNKIERASARLESHLK